MCGCVFAVLWAYCGRWCFCEWVVGLKYVGGLLEGIVRVFKFSCWGFSERMSWQG